MNITRWSAGTVRHCRTFILRAGYSACTEYSVLVPMVSA